MEDILKEILYELKGIRQALDKGNNIPLTITMGDDVIAEKVVSNINRQNRISGKTGIVI